MWTLRELWLQVFVYSSLWAAGSVAALTAFACHILALPALLPAALVFCSAVFIYNLDHIADARVEKMQAEESIAYFSSWPIYLLTALSGVATFALALEAPLPARACFAVYATAGLLYGLPLVPMPDLEGRWAMRRLKEIPFSKGWLVGGCITVGTVLMPALWREPQLTWDSLQLALFIFVYTSSNTHMFDVRDLREDRQHHVLTLPVALGVRRTKHALVLLNLVILTGMMWGWAADLVQPHPEMLLSSLVAISWVLWLRVDTPRHIYGTLIDGCCYLPLLLVGFHHVGP